MKYVIDCSDRMGQYMKVLIEAENIQGGTRFQLPIWRPGRYEAANYAKYLRSFDVTTEDGDSVPFRKLNASTWEVLNAQPANLQITYEFHAGKLDAGS